MSRHSTSVDLEAEVNYRLTKDHGKDPEKIWVVLQYPDSLMVTASKLDKLLECLRKHPDKSLLMDQFEWTLSGRVNCKEDEEKISSVEQTDDTSTTPIVKLKPVMTSGSYYSVTAPVHNTPAKLSPKHCVSTHTNTIIVDMRYKFRAKQLRVWNDKNKQEVLTDTATVLDCVADRVRELVTQNMISSSDLNDYKVYVLKPQNQTFLGVSPRPGSMELGESLGFPPVDQDSMNPPSEKKPKLEP